MEKDKKIILTIAARGGSKGVKNKNIRILASKPLIAYTILQAKMWGKADKIICSTDSNQIADVAKQFGAEVPFMRPLDLAGDEAGKIDVLRHALMKTEELTGEKYDILIDLDATAPVRKLSDIDNAYKFFLKKSPKSLFSVTKCRKNPYFNMVEVGPDGYAALSKKLDGSVKRRQDAPKVYDMNASIYVYRRDYLLDKSTQSAISDRSIAYEMDNISAFDIDTEEDFLFLEYLLEKGKVKL